jgi:hypothetical protein
MGVSVTMADLSSWDHRQFTMESHAGRVVFTGGSGPLRTSRSWQYKSLALWSAFQLEDVHVIESTFTNIMEKSGSGLVGGQ